MLRKASDVIAQGDLGSVVDYVIDLNRRASWLNQQLDQAKAHLRLEARKLRGGAFSHDIEGSLGTVTVTFPGLALKVKKGVDLQELEVNLSEDDFAALFKKTIEIVAALDAEDFEEALGKLKPATRTMIARYISSEEQTPKVYVPR